jgi:demethylmenaquinone methyltransferase / 2-methoxy-6-polyprenyl-1,4-benzoquinol methylase
MREAIEKGKLKIVYDHVAGRYDLQHSLLTARSDQRGRALLVEHAVRAGDRVLDCGAGTGSTGLLAIRKAGPCGKLLLFDMSERMLAVAKDKIERSEFREQVQTQIGDILDLPFEDSTFDVVLSTYSLCPVYDPAKGAQELYRVVRPGGRIGIAHSTEPSQPAIKWFADRLEDAVWRIPSLSLGCRSVVVLPTLERLGCKVLFARRIGIPLWPFLVFVVETPIRPSECKRGD